jgi:hypothetical protein
MKAGKGFIPGRLSLARDRVARVLGNLSQQLDG